jgi:tetratricopeptide (TPR) repeat protein
LGDVYGAEALFERSIALDFAPRQTYYHLATVQIERGDYDEAAENLERCLTRFVDEAVYINYAQLKANAGDYAAAREAISFLLATYPSEEIAARARYIEAVIAAQTGDLFGATALLEALVEDVPSFETGYIGLGSIYEARGMTAEARATFEAALATIERKLERAQQTLADRETITAEEYGKLRTDIANYQQQRETVLQRLAQLPSNTP